MMTEPRNEPSQVNDKTTTVDHIDEVKNSTVGMEAATYEADDVNSEDEVVLSIYVLSSMYTCLTGSSFSFCSIFHKKLKFLN